MFHKNSEITFITIIICFLSLSCYSQESEKMFGREEVLQDLNYLCESLQDAHYNLYAYTSKEEFEENFQNVKRTIVDDSISALQATTIFQKVISAANNGHTEIDFPGASYISYAYSGGTLFPLEIAFENNKSLIRKNYTSNSEIKIASEIVKIDGIAMKDVLEKIYPQISAERTYLKNAKIEMYSFPRLYWQVFGQQDVFNIEIQEGENTKRYAIDAIPLIEGYENKRDELLNTKRGIKFIESSSYLNPGPFSGDEAKYQKFIDSAFVQINIKNTENLIIDLRNNSGGNNSFSDYLVSYIADKPFNWSSRLTVKSSKFLKAHTRKYYDTTDAYFRKILDLKDGELYNVPLDECQPQVVDKRFNNNIYVLINRQSHSQAAVAAAQIQDYNFGTIVGEETGDYPTLYASLFEYALPNTGIKVKVAKGQIVRVNGSKNQEGVIPDILIQDHLLDTKDEVLNWLLLQLK